MKEQEFTMNEITISITYRTDDCTTEMYQIGQMERKYAMNKLHLTEISWEREWVPGKSRVTFKGVEK